MSRIVLVEADPLVRAGLTRLLEEGGLEVLASVPDASDLPRRPRFALLVLDLVAEGAPATDTIEALDRPVLVLAESLTDVALTDVLGVGARGVLLKRSVPDLLVQAVTSIVAGGVFLDPLVANRLVALMTRGQRGSGRYGLTTQERRVLSLLPDERTNREIAAQLGISIETVKTHLRNGMRKLDALDRIDAARIVSENGLDSL